MFIKLRRSPVVKRLVREVGVVVVDPFVDGNFEVKWVIPIVTPDNIFFDGAHDTFSIRVALWV